MGTAMYTDAWSTQGKPLTDDSPPVSTTSSVGASEAAASSPGSSSISSMVSRWAESALGPTAVTVGRELGQIAKQLTAPGQIQRPWLWIGAAGLVGYTLGRANVMRPVAKFALRHAFTTLVERALRAG